MNSEVVVSGFCLMEGIFCSLLLRDSWLKSARFFFHMVVINIVVVMRTELTVLPTKLFFSIFDMMYQVVIQSRVIQFFWPLKIRVDFFTDL